MMSWRSTGQAAAGGALVLALAGCGSPLLVTDPPASSYSRLGLSYAAGGRDFRVVIHGNPFGGDRAAFEQAVLAAFESGYSGPPTHFTATPGPSVNPPYRLVLAFNARQPLNQLSLCLQDQIATEPSSGRLLLQAAFCQWGGAETSLTGYLDAPIESVADPRFQSLVHQAAVLLFPVNNPDQCTGFDC